MGEHVKRLTVTIPVEQFELIKRLVEQDATRYPSMSAFVADAIADRLGDEDALEMLIATVRELDGEPTAEDIAWAEDALKVVARAAGTNQDAKGAA